MEHISIVTGIIKKEMGVEPIKIDRMVIGMCNEVYAVTLPSTKVIVRMNSNVYQLKGTAKHINLFSSMGIKVPQILACDYNKKDFPFGYQVLSYIKGKDLGLVIESMNDEQLKILAKEVADIFNKLSKVPTNGKFGWVGEDESGLVDSWAEIMKSDKIEKRNNETGVVGDELVQKEKELYEKYIPYFNSVKSILYFDDMNSKNVLVDEGKFSGLVDLDEIMYGDPLEAVGAIKASWYGTRCGDLYTNAVQDELNLTKEQREIVTVYALLNRILWLSEKGVKFNANTTTEINKEAVEKDKKIIGDLFLELSQM